MKSLAIQLSPSARDYLHDMQDSIPLARQAVELIGSKFSQTTQSDLKEVGDLS